MADTLLGSLGKSPGLKHEGTVLSLPPEVSEPAVGLMGVTPGPGPAGSRWRRSASQLTLGAVIVINYRVPFPAWA